MKKNIAIICSYPMPVGMAASTRIMAYSKGMVENGSEVTVFSYVPSGYLYSSDSKDEDVYEGVAYCYPFRKKRFKNRFLHFLEIIWSIFLTKRRLKTESKKQKIDVIIISNDNPFILLLFSKIARKLNSKSIFIFDEYPIPIRRYLKSKIPNWKRKMYKMSLKRLDGYISMTDNLLTYYNSIIPKPSLLLVSIIDIDRFTLKGFASPKISDTEIRITYMGNMELSKDNIDNIIRAFAITSTHSTLKLKLELFGAPSKKDKSYLINLINDLELKDSVMLKFAKFEEVPMILKNSHILVSSQPNTKRAQGGFPTKLGEYLATGNPTLVTDVGEISKFVENNVNVFLAHTEDPIAFSNKLDYILNNYSQAKIIARKGKELIKEKYSARMVTKNIIEFVNQI